MIGFPVEAVRARQDRLQSHDHPPAYVISPSSGLSPFPELLPFGIGMFRISTSEGVLCPLSQINRDTVLTHLFRAANMPGMEDDYQSDKENWHYSADC